MNIEASRDFLKYSFTLVGVALAWTQARLGGGDSLFGMSTIAGYEAGAVMRIVVVVLLFLLVAALIFCLIAISYATRVENLAAQLKPLEEDLVSENARLVSRNQPPVAAGAKLVKKRDDVTQAREGFGRNARRHWRAVIGSSVIFGVLFINDTLFPEAAPPDCVLSVDEAGRLVVGADCAKRLLQGEAD